MVFWVLEIERERGDAFIFSPCFFTMLFSPCFCGPCWFIKVSLVMFEPHAKRGIILDAKVAKDVEPTLSPLSGVYQMFSCHRISYSYKISTAGCPFPWV
jgi:hypothetical protein